MARLLDVDAFLVGMRMLGAPALYRADTTEL